MIEKQFTLYLENKPGELARVAKVLLSAKVNIEGISVSASSDVGLVQLVVSKAKVARSALNKAGVSFTVQDVSVLLMKNKPGSLSLLVSKLAASGVNINYVYATACTGKGCHCNVVISAADLRKVEKIWLKIR